MIDVVEHEAKVAQSAKAEIRGFSAQRGQLRLRLNEFETGGKFTRAETRLMKTLALAGAAVESVEMLARVVTVVRPRRQLEARGNDISNVGEHGRCALLTIFFNDDMEIANLAAPSRFPDRRDWHLGAHFVAAYRLKAD